ncbi:MAG TPA: LysR family transcriptional regulator [Kofleriaceae bacterium]|nr:LysR family transcriptional regulator [Kofleriaceae bacterium]
MLNYNHLHYFHTVASEGSVAAAAQRLGVTQPTVSEQLRTLERALGVRLFERSSGGVKLTSAGRIAYDQTSVMFRAGERLVEALGTKLPTVPRSLRVGISHAASRSTATEFLLPLLAIDDCLPSIGTGDALDLLRGLRGNDLDLALVESEPPEATRQGLELVKIDETQLVAVAAPAISPSADWQDVRFIHYRPASWLRWEVEAFLEARGLQPRVAAEVDDPMFLVEAAARGACVVVVPRSVARDSIKAGRLHVLATVDPTRAGLFALYQTGPSAELARNAVESLVAHARALGT